MRPKTKLTFHDLEILVQQGESDVLEFKKTTAELTAAARTLCGFLNHHGGHLLIGVMNNLRIIRQDVSDQTLQDIASTLKKIEPTPIIDVTYVHVKDSSSQVIILTAHHDEFAVPYTFEGRAYDRSQSTTSIMPRDRYHRLLLEKTQESRGWEDGTVKDIHLDDLDHDEIIKTIQVGVSSGRIPPTKLTNDPLEALTRLHLVKNGLFLNAAIVLFAKDPIKWLPQCRIRLARFRGNDKRHFLDNRQVEGHAFHLLEEALIFIQRYLPIESRFEPGKIERIDAPLVPIDALREILVNALCHRDYRATGGSISCAIYDDRLEIWNEGSLLEGLKFLDLKSLHESRPRNPHIARVFYCRKLFESWGGGIELVSNLCKQDGGLDPIFFELSGGFCVRIPFRYSIGPLQAEASLTIEPPLKVTPNLKPRHQEILNLLDNKKELSFMDIQKKFSEVSERTLVRDLVLLEKLNLIKRQGESRSTLWKKT